jgi:hypothetical protein
MKFSDEILMAFADGELAEPARSEVERAMRSDPAVAERVALHRALRSRVSNAFRGVLDEPVPPRLQAGLASGKVVHLDAVRAARQQQVREHSRWSWPQWGAMAASLVAGVLAGALGLRSLQGDSELASMSVRDGALVAEGRLDTALTRQLASAAEAGGQVRIGVSFASKDGTYCRSFAMGTAAGLACRRGGQWAIPVLAEGAPGAPGAYRQASSEMPPAVLAAIDQRLSGAALDASEERAARQGGWKR